MIEEFFIQCVTIRFNIWLNFHTEKIKGIFQCFIFCIASHFYLSPASVLTNYSF